MLTVSWWHAAIFYNAVSILNMLILILLKVLNG